MSRSQDILIVLNGDKPLSIDGKYDYVICADGAYDFACSRCKVDLVIGDMDSISAIPSNVDIAQYPVDKDYTDGQLAVFKALELAPRSITVVGASGGRVDHMLYNLSLCSYCTNTTSIVVVDDKYKCRLLASGINTLSVQKNSIVSLVPYFGLVHINSTVGLEYPIVSKDIVFDSDIATICNIATANEVVVDIASGRMLILYDIKE